MAQTQIEWSKLWGNRTIELLFASLFLILVGLFQPSQILTLVQCVARDCRGGEEMWCTTLVVKIMRHEEACVINLTRGINLSKLVFTGTIS